MNARPTAPFNQNPSYQSSPAYNFVSPQEQQGIKPVGNTQIPGFKPLSEFENLSNIGPLNQNLFGVNIQAGLISNEADYDDFNGDDALFVSPSNPRQEAQANQLFL